MKSTFSLYISEFSKQIKMRTRIAIILLSMLIPGMAFSQTETSSSNLETLLIVVIILLIIVSILVLVVAIYTLYVLRSLLLGERERKAAAEGIEPEQSEDFWQNISKSLTKSTPVVEEESILMDHDYDGIRELDNHLPPWWKFLFYFTIIWAGVYLLVYHVFNVLPLSGEEYDREVEQAEAALEARQALMSESIDENTVEFTDDPVILANGETIFKAQCVVCHAADGGGGVGPNFTDEYWLHGGSINSIFQTIKYGVPEKGMISWQSQLPPSAMRDVACYIYTLRGTTPANPKAPQGDIYIEEVPAGPGGEPENSESIEEDSSVAMVQ
ncbi:cbb3-type cytochrome c oxidase N-terminal domain-containing protein [Bacteroidota bacterium]